MKNYIYTKSSTLIAIDTNDATNYSLNRGIYANVDDVFLIDEDGTFTLSKDEVYEVKAGDIVYVLYPIKVDRGEGYKRDIVIVSNEKLYDYYVKYKEENNRCPLDLSTSNLIKEPCCEAGA